jgi:hypothetical protein
MCAQKDWECGQRDGRLGNPMRRLFALERRVAQQVGQWSAPAPDGADITLEGDEIYTRVGENLPPQ